MIRKEEKKRGKGRLIGGLYAFVFQIFRQVA
jgi:hypothetical protein